MVALRLFTIDLEREGIPKYHIAIGGFKGYLIDGDTQSMLDRVRAIEDDKSILAVQIFDAERIATYLHLLASAIHALYAFADSRAISNTLRAETLLYSSAQRQITEAIDRIGVGSRSHNLAALVVALSSDAAAESINRICQITKAEMDDTVLSMADHRKQEIVMRIFGIDKPELESAKAGTSDSDVESAITKRVLSRITIMAISK
jgi:tRNA threonylcarbamoyladenosine modification (KEOPS) complex Cgi121 subunit